MMGANASPFDGQEEPEVISDINITPFIDIMLVLLIIFMVAAPLMMGGVHVNLPKTDGSPMPRPVSPVIVSIDAEYRIFVDKEELQSTDRHAFFQELAKASETGEVYVRGDGEVKYAKMMELMSELGQAGFSRVTLVTNVSGNSESSGPAKATSHPGDGEAPDGQGGSPAIREGRQNSASSMAGAKRQAEN